MYLTQLLSLRIDLCCMNTGYMKESRAGEEERALLSALEPNEDLSLPVCGCVRPLLAFCTLWDLLDQPAGLNH